MKAIAVFENIRAWPWDMIGSLATIGGVIIGVFALFIAFKQLKSALDEQGEKKRAERRNELRAKAEERRNEFRLKAQERNRELRLEEVHLWANRCIEQLQHLRLIAIGDISYSDREQRQKTLQDIAITLSIRIEKGRLFFKNNEDYEHGKSKQSAYRGYRPLILDQLVIAHQAALLWQEACDEKKGRLQPRIDTAVREFVSLAQHEVGRQQALSEYASGPGADINLAKELEQDLEEQEAAIA
jgi:hypothetical protein